MTRRTVNNNSLRSMWLLAIGALVLTGGIYRLIDISLEAHASSPIKLAIPLKDFPIQLGTWTGKDVEIPEHVQRSAGNDDYFYRTYIDQVNNRWVNVYVAYSARPRRMLGHKPQTCYVAGGWINEESHSEELITDKGTKLPCLIHEFRLAGPDNDRIFVLNYYVLNGRLTSSDEGFSGLGWRTPNIARDPASYVAQIQISSAVEESAIAAAADITDEILDHLPDGDGRIRAAKTVSEASGSKQL